MTTENSETPPAPSAHLAPQQRTALWLFACGNSYQQISEIMKLALPTVKEYLMRAYRALDARNGAQAVHLAYQAGVFLVRRDTEPEDEQ